MTTLAAARSSGLEICVIGGSGFVGTELVARLTGNGHRVRVLSRTHRASQHLRLLPNAEVLVADANDPGVLARAFNGIDVVVNLVGILNERGLRGAGFESAHVALTASVIAAARTQRVARLLHMSSLGADAVQGPSHYLRSKGRAEALVHAAGDVLDFTIFRPSVIFGPRDTLTNRFAVLLRLSAGFLPLARAKARFAPIYVGDVVGAVERAVRGGETSRQTYELCGPETMSLRELVERTARHAGLPCHIVALPDFVGLIQGYVMNIVPGKPFSSDNYRSLTVDSVCAQDGCGRLGIEPQSLAAIAPAYLGARRRTRRLAAHRHRAGRG